MKVSHKSGLLPPGSIVVKLQSVRVVPLTIGDGVTTIGQHIDTLIGAEQASGSMPNKLVIDLNPPREESYPSMD